VCCQKEKKPSKGIKKGKNVSGKVAEVKTPKEVKEEKKNHKKERKYRKFTPRLFTLGIIAGYRRNMRKQYRHTSILKLDGVRVRRDAKFYLGKRVAYLYKDENPEKKGKNRFEGRRVIFGKIVKLHGTSGAVKAKFQPQLPPTSIGKPCRIFLYPSSI